MPPTIDLTIANARRLTDQGSVLPVPLAKKLLDELEDDFAKITKLIRENERLKAEKKRRRRK